MLIAQDLVDEARRTPAFRTLEPRHVIGLFRTMQDRTVARGKLLFRKGSPGDTMVVVVSGLLGVTLDEDGKSQPITVVPRGHVVGEMSFLDPAPRSATVVALEDTHLLELRRETLDTLTEEQPELLIAFLTGVTHRVTASLLGTDKRIKASIRFLKDRPGAGSLEGLLEPMSTRPPPDPGPAPAGIDLRCFPQFASHTNDELGMLVARAPAFSYPAGTYLCREGQPGAHAFILVQGQVEILERIGDADTRVATIPAGELIGQIALLRKSPRTASARAVGPVVALRIDMKGFRALLDRRHPMAMTMYMQVGTAAIRQLRNANLRLERLLELVELVNKGLPLPLSREPDARQGQGPLSGPRVGDPDTGSFEVDMS